jgi:hypothetical protein
MSTQAPRIVVPVLGMHRSGTSLTTGILSALGVSLSEDLMPATEANAIGYFESLGITAIHDELLKALGNSWHGSTTLSPFPPNWWRLPHVAQYKEQLKARVSDDIARVSGAWGFKDPRTCRLLPLWYDIFAELNLEPRFVLVGRHPRDVARSLQARDGLSPQYSELLWLEHTAAAVINTKDRTRAIVDYNRWFEDPLGEAQYLISTIGFETPDEQTIRDVVAKYVSSELRHHATVTEECQLPFSRELYQSLRERDVRSIEMLADLFEVASVFANRVTRPGMQPPVFR